MARPLPGFIEQAAYSAKRCAMFIRWEPLRDLSRPLMLDRRCFRKDGCNYERGDQRTADAAVAYFHECEPDLVFVYFGMVDEIGHDFDCMSAEYLRQIGCVDAPLGTALDALNEDAYVLL